jgi:uncharacterized protein
MKTLFVDAWFWIALNNPHDKENYKKALAMRDTLKNALVVTTDEVLVEFLAFFSWRGSIAREQAAALVESLLDSNVEVIPQTRDSFLKGLELYKKRRDKQYSLTDCISMQTMMAMSIQEVLTHDHHFTQEGFKRLLN